MRKNHILISTILCFCTLTAARAPAETVEWRCTNAGHEARLNVSDQAVKVELDGVSCGTLQLDRAFRPGAAQAGYRNFALVPNDCEKPDRFEVTTLAGVKIHYLDAVPNSQNQVLFDFDLFDDLGAHRPYTASFQCTEYSPSFASCEGIAKRAAIAQLQIDTNGTTPNPEVTDLYEMDPGQYSVEITDEESTYRYVVDTQLDDTGRVCRVTSVVAN